MILPRAFAAMLMGGGEVRQPRRRFNDRIRFETHEGAVHPSEGAFVVDEQSVPAGVGRVVLTAVHPGAVALADEAMRLSAAANAPAPETHPPED